MPITGSSNLTLGFLEGVLGLSDDRLDYDDVVVAPLIFGVVGVLLSPTRSRTEETEELLLLEAVSKSKVFSLEVREGLLSNNFPKLTLKIESVGTLGVDN